MSDVFDHHDTCRNNRSHWYRAASTNPVQLDKPNPKRAHQYQHFNTSMAKDSQPFSTMLASLDPVSMQPLCWIPKEYTTAHTTRKLDTLYYQETCFWHWRMSTTEQLLFQHALTAAMCSAIPILCQCNMIKFSPTIPTPMPFTRPPITPVNPTTGYVWLPPAQVALSIPEQAAPVAYRALQQQFQFTLKLWQKPMFGNLHKLGPTYTLHNVLHTQQPVSIISNVSIQNVAIAALPGSFPNKPLFYGGGKAWHLDQLTICILDVLKHSESWLLSYSCNTISCATTPFPSILPSTVSATILGYHDNNLDARQ